MSEAVIDRLSNNLTNQQTVEAMLMKKAFLLCRLELYVSADT
jgi:hypothetical protein